MSSEKCLRHPTVRARSCKECARIASSTMDIHRRQLHCQEGSASVVIKVTANVMRMILHAPGEVDGGHPELSPKTHIQPMEYGFAPVESGQAVSFVVDLQHLIAGFNTVASIVTGVARRARASRNELIYNHFSKKKGHIKEHLLRDSVDAGRATGRGHATRVSLLPSYCWRSIHVYSAHRCASSADRASVA
jgi:hypothetical protein